MKNLFLLLSPRVWSLKNSFFKTASGDRKKAFVIGSFGIIFWAVIFILSSRILTYFQSIDVIGDLLAHHLLSMILLTFFSLLVFSNILIALSNLFLSADLELCHSAPSAIEEIFLSRWVFTILDSSWMVAMFGLPVMMAYAYVFKPSLSFYFALFNTGIATAVIASGIGILFTMIMVNIFPAHRTRDILMLLAILLVAVVYIMIRILKPERLVDPDAFFSVMQYVSALKSTDSPYLPTHWMTEILWGKLKDPDSGRHLFETVLLWSTAAAIIVLNLWTAGWIYLKGFSRSQEAKKRRAGRYILDLFIRLVRKPLKNDLASLIDKDIRIFFRDNTQWSQLFLLGALIIVYLFNFSVLPLEKSAIRLEFLQNILAFLNMGLAGFVLSAVSVRFAFPSVSAEGGAFWIIKSSPVSMGRLLLGKYVLYIFPMTVLGEVLIIITNYLLHVDTLMMILSSVTMLFAFPAIIAMAIGFGAVYPKFKYENISQVATGFGGLMYMICSAGFMAVIILIESVPVRLFFLAQLRGRELTVFHWGLIVLAFSAVFLLICFTIYKSMKIGLRALERYEKF
jgi:ABC-2 type transport system permease protein